MTAQTVKNSHAKTKDIILVTQMQLEVFIYQEIGRGFNLVCSILNSILETYQNYLAMMLLNADCLTKSASEGL